MPLVPAPHKNAPMPVASPKFTVGTGHSKSSKSVVHRQTRLHERAGTLKYIEMKASADLRLRPNGLDIEKETTSRIVRWTRMA